MEEKVRVGAVSYLNTKPLIFGLERLPVRHQITLTVDYPANVAGQLLQNRIDLGLVPVAILPEMPEYYIDSNYCIGANGRVGSVAIFSEVPLAQVDTLLLDYQSRTSVNLARILLKHYWKMDVRLEKATEGYQQRIRGNTAGVVIGDRAFTQRIFSPFEYDLAEAWKAFTGLPFVFAAWVANKPLAEAFIDAFDQANAYGLDHLNEVIREIKNPHTDLYHYFTREVSYPLDEAKREGLKVYLEMLREFENLKI